MDFNPLRTIFSLYTSDNDNQQDHAGKQHTAQAEEISFIAHLFRKYVRAEDVAPLMWGRFHKLEKKKRREKLRKVNKKSDCPKSQLRKREHESDDGECPFQHFI